MQYLYNDGQFFYFMVPETFEQIAARVLKERPVIYLYHRNWLWAYNARLGGVRGLPDGLLRVAGLKTAP